MALWRNRDGTRTLEAPASAYWSLIGGGWTLVDPNSIVIPTPGKTIGSLTIDGNLLTATYSDGTTQVLTLPATVGGGGGGTTGVAIDTDGRPYFTAGGTAAVAIDTDGRYYFPGA